MNEINELLQDVIGLHSYMGEYVVIFMLIVFNVLYFIKKNSLFQTLLMNVLSIILTISFIINSARINEWATWYIVDTDIYSKFQTYSNLDFGIIIIAIAFIVIDIGIYLYRKKHN